MTSGRARPGGPGADAAETTLVPIGPIRAVDPGRGHSAGMPAAIG
jgi:hypothetical protein